MLDRLRGEKAIEAKGGEDGDPVQAVFDVSSGEFRGAAHADGGAGVTEADPGDELRERFGDDAEAVLEALADVDVAETPPVELLSRVQEWQRQLDEG